MKTTDIEQIHAAGLITRRAAAKGSSSIFELKEDGGNKFLAIVSLIGAVLITRRESSCSSPRTRTKFRAAGKSPPASRSCSARTARAGGCAKATANTAGLAGHCISSAPACTLANIALLGQIYNLVSRPPDAFLLWWLGIAALPWLLRSKAQHVLLLLAFGIWFGFEVNDAREKLDLLLILNGRFCFMRCCSAWPGLARAIVCGRPNSASSPA